MNLNKKRKKKEHSERAIRPGDSVIGPQEEVYREGSSKVVIKSGKTRAGIKTALLFFIIEKLRFSEMAGAITADFKRRSPGAGLLHRVRP